MKAAGIDIGTTTISAAVVDIGDRKAVWTQTWSNSSFLPTEHSWERIQDMGHIVPAAKDVLDTMLDRYEDIGSIGLTGQMHGCLYVDLEGRCVSPLYTWQDGRGDLPCVEQVGERARRGDERAGQGEESNGRGDERARRGDERTGRGDERTGQGEESNGRGDRKTLREEIEESCGASVPSGYGLLTHLYNQRKGLVPVGAASLCTAADYLGMALTGRREPLLHSSMAASLGFFDVRAGRFDVGKLEAVGIDRSILPAVTDQLKVLGGYRGIPVTVPLGDHQAAFFGAVGKADPGGAVSVNIGTGGQISVLSDRYREISGIETRPYMEGRYLLAGASLCGGRAYAALERFFRSYMTAAGGPDRPQYDTMARLAEKGLSSGKRLDVATTFRGTRTDPTLRGSIRGISEEDLTPEALVYGVLYGIAQELYGMYERIQESTGGRARHIVGSGNGIRKNPILQQIVRQMFQAELTLAPCGEEAAYGAALSSVGASES